MLTPLFAFTLLLASGCKQRSEENPRAVSSPKQENASPEHNPAGPDSVPRQLQPLDENVFELSGPIDVENRYPFTVIVDARFKERIGRCSGVVIHPRLVLTAGHCVCTRQEVPSTGGRGETFIDSSSCAASATVTTVTYRNRRESDLERRTTTGSIRPHPGLKIVLSAENIVLSSKADLATILLDKSLEDASHPVPLSKAEIQVGEFVTIVGYGYDEIADGYNGDRRFSRERVNRIPSDPGTAIIEPAGRLYKADSGGPCLRESPQGATLVGVSARGLGEGGAFTSISTYRDWLETQLRHLDMPQ